MGDFSSKEIEDIKNLYESVLSGEETDIEEGWWRDRGADLNRAASNVGNAIVSSTGAAIEGIQGKKIPGNRRMIARATNATVRGVRDAVVDFSKGVSSGKSTPKNGNVLEDMELEMNILEAKVGDTKEVNGKRYVFTKDGKWVDAAGRSMPTAPSSKPEPPKPDTSKPKPYNPSQERTDLKVVSGGKSGYVSKMPKPTQGGIPGETPDQFRKRQAEYQKSQQLADRLNKEGGLGKYRKPPASTPSASTPPASTPPASTPPAATPPASTRPSGTPSAPAPTAPKPSPVAAYMKAAADARKSGDPAQMAKVRDMGMDIWRKSNPKLAAAAAERERIRGTAQTDNPLMKDMRSGLPVTPTVQAPAVKDLGAGQQSLSQNQYAGRSPEPKIQVSKDATMNKTAETLSKNPLPKKTQKEAYDIVLDYIISEGHADTLSEAHYVMLQMDAEHIQNIVEAQRVLAQRTINGVTVPGYVNVEKQGGFLGFGAKNVPVKGSFRPASVSSGSAARYNQQIDTKYGTGSNKDAMPALRVQQRALNQGSSGYMRVRNPDAIPNTGAADRPTPQRAGDQNRALDLLRPDVPIKSTVSPTPDNLRDPEFRRSGGWTGDPNAGRTAPAPKSTAPKSTAPKSTAPKSTAPKSTAPKPAAKPAPVAPVPKPQPSTIQSKNVTAGGTSYERRTPTSAELAAAKAAGGGEAGVKAAVDVAKSNKVAATSPTPDLKPEAPKKRESLAAQVKELQAMRKSSEERQK